MRTMVMLALALSGLAWSKPALAQGMSSWQGDQSGRVRLIAGARQPDGKLLAGLEFDLAEGWKTYWRVPGDSGVPSVFMWNNSKNVKSIKVHWPAPSRFKDKFGWNNGYKKDFVFPVEIEAENPAEPVQLELLMYYGVCEELCIPGKANLSLTLAPEGYAGYQALIARYLEMVPKPADKDSAVRVQAVRVDETNKGLALNVTVNQRSAEPVNLFVEGPDTLFFDVPKRKSAGEAGQTRFHIQVDGADNVSDLKGKELRFTAVQGQLRLEQTLRVD